MGQGKKSGVSIPKANALVESQVFPAGLGIGVPWRVSTEPRWPGPSVGLFVIVSVSTHGLRDI